MFSAIQSPTLGKSNCSNCKSYNPSTVDTMNVSFKPIKNSCGNTNFIAVVEEDNEIINIPKDMQIDDESEELYKTGNIYANINEEDDNKNNIFSLNNDYVKTFYIGSVTVVGLYILFRILNKTK
jgi:hypothetical protein